MDRGDEIAIGGPEWRYCMPQDQAGADIGVYSQIIFDGLSGTSAIPIEFLWSGYSQSFENLCASLYLDDYSVVFQNHKPLLSDLIVFANDRLGYSTIYTIERPNRHDFQVIPSHIRAPRRTIVDSLLAMREELKQRIIDYPLNHPDADWDNYPRAEYRDNALLFLPYR